MKKSMARRRLPVLSALPALPALAVLALAATALPVTGAAAEPAKAPVMVVLDASGSMNAKDVDGGTRIAAARHAADSLVDEVPGGSRLGLMVYGTSTGNSASDKKAGCRDIKTLADVGPVDKAALKRKIGGITASGYTPIGAALKAAATKLPAKGHRSIVLVSDGIDTCSPPDPCAVARELKRHGVDLTVNAVGFKVAGAARNQLTCIADATGGSYSDAHDAKTLTRTMHVETKRGFDGYKPEGTRVHGGQSAGAAPTIKPGQYTDALKKGSSSMYADDGSKLYYRVHAEPGQRIDFGATAIEPAKGSDSAPTAFSVHEKLLDAAGKDCVNDTSVYSGSARRTPDYPLPLTATIQSYPVGSSRAECSQKSGDFIVEVDRYATNYRGHAIPIEIRVGIEPKADASGLKPAYEKAQPKVEPTPSGSVRTVHGGASFNSAPVVTPGTFSDTLMPGQTKYYAVPLSFGQRLAYSISSSEAPKSPDATYLLDAQMATPMRQSIVNATWGADFKSGGLVNLQDSPLSGTMIAPVRYTNRRSKDDFIKPLSMDGTYYLAVKLNSDGRRNPDKNRKFPLLVTIGTPGHVERGPRYVDTSEPTPKPSTKSSAAAAAASMSSGPGAWYRKPAVAGGAIGVLLLAAIVAIGVPVVRRRTRP